MTIQILLSNKDKYSVLSLLLKDCTTAVYISFYLFFYFSAEFNMHSLLQDVSEWVFMVTLHQFRRNLPDTG